MFTDVFGKSARSITEYILSHPGEKFNVAPFVDRRCKTPIDQIQAAVDGAISHEQAVKLRECLNHIDELNAHRDRIESEILQLVEPFSAQLALIRTVPGMDKDPMTAILILSEIGSDMSAFPSAKNLVSWAGCCPRNDKSAKQPVSLRLAVISNRFLSRLQTLCSIPISIRSLQNVIAVLSPIVVTRKP